MLAQKSESMQWLTGTLRGHCGTKWHLILSTRDNGGAPGQSVLDGCCVSLCPPQQLVANLLGRKVFSIFFFLAQRTDCLSAWIPVFPSQSMALQNAAGHGHWKLPSSWPVMVFDARNVLLWALASRRIDWASQVSKSGKKADLFWLSSVVYAFAARIPAECRILYHPLPILLR